MGFHCGVADPSGDGSCTELLSGFLIFNRDKQPASALPKLWIFLHKTKVISESSNWIVWSTKIILTNKDC